MAWQAIPLNSWRLSGLIERMGETHPYSSLSNGIIWTFHVSEVLAKVLIITHSAFFIKLTFRTVNLLISVSFAICVASLVAQMVKSLPAMQETQVWSLGWGDTLEKGMATHSSILAWRIPWTEETGRLSLWDHKESAMIKRLTLTFFQRTRVLNGEMFGSLFW